MSENRSLHLNKKEFVGGTQRSRCPHDNRFNEAQKNDVVQPHLSIALTPDAREGQSLARTVLEVCCAKRLCMMNKKQCTAWLSSFLPNILVLGIDVVWRTGCPYIAETFPLPLHVQTDCDL